MHFLTLKDIVNRNDLQFTLLAFLITAVYLLIFLNYGQILPVYGAVLAVLFLIIVCNPHIGIYLTIFGTFIFERFFTLQALEIEGVEYKLYFLDFILLFTVIGVGWQWLSGYLKREHFAWIKRELPLLVFLGVVLLSFVRGFFIEGSFFPLAFSTFKNYALYSVVFFLVMLLFQNEKRRNDLYNVMLWSGALVFIFLFIGIARGEGLWSEYTPLSTSGVRLIAGTHVFYLTMLGIFLVALWLDPRLSLGRRGRAFIFGGLLFTAGAFGVALVRHLWLAGGVVLLFWLLFLAPPLRTRLLKLLGQLFVLFLSVYTVVVLAVAAWGIHAPFVERAAFALLERLNLETWVTARNDTSVSYRYALWGSAVRVWLTHPLFGVGFGQFIEGALDGEHAVNLFAAPVRDVHNNYFGMLVQMGLVGFGVIIWWFWSILCAIIREVGRQTAFHVPLFWAESMIILFLVIFGFSVYLDINLFNIWWWFVLAVWRLERGGYPLYAHSPNT